MYVSPPPQGLQWWRLQNFARQPILALLLFKFNSLYFPLHLTLVLVFTVSALKSSEHVEQSFPSSFEVAVCKFLSVFSGQ